MELFHSQTWHHMINKIHHLHSVWMGNPDPRIHFSNEKLSKHMDWLFHLKTRLGQFSPGTADLKVKIFLFIQGISDWFFSHIAKSNYFTQRTFLSWTLNGRVKISEKNYAKSDNLGTKRFNLRKAYPHLLFSFTNKGPIDLPWKLGQGRTPDKSVELKINFLISQAKHILWVLKRPVSMRGFLWAPKTHV